MSKQVVFEIIQQKLLYFRGNILSKDLNLAFILLPQYGLLILQYTSG